MAETTFFLIASGVCVFAFLAVIARDIFHCAVWLALALLSIAGIYFYLDAEFLGIIQVLVYVGGIITLFVFAIKLTAKIGESSIFQTNEQLGPSIIVSLILFYFLFKVIHAHPWAAVNSQAPSLSLAALGKSLVTTYVLPFEFISLLLLAVIVGAIVIGRTK
mgnify:CR=1 FL=1